ncbi:hypothetical protein FFLO_03431 [Filobasidium floriforme]|uniref:Uncharacterized protein n=1 Tax=Filobasidium floriforme TaxID=5210 RepID=A0A8K0NT49_9TREE|nr:hypothetical protein FFLO_03431 [Filobasidium floriforme]
MSFLASANYSPWALPAMWLVSISPHFLAVGLFDSYRAKGTPKWNNASPRQQWTNEHFKSAKISKTAQDMILRAEGAQSNGFENLAFFAVAQLAGNVAKLPASTLNTFAASYLLSRLAYNAAYILITDDTASKLRSILYLTGVFLNSSMFIKACNVLSKSVL